MPASAVEITIFETPRGHWGIRGLPGDELDLNYTVQVRPPDPGRSDRPGRYGTGSANEQSTCQVRPASGSTLLPSDDNPG